MATRNLTIEEAERALDRAREVEAERAAAERVEAERQAQAEHDREQAKVIDTLVRDTDRAIADAQALAESMPVSRAAAGIARLFLWGELHGGELRNPLLAAVEPDPAAQRLYDLFEHVVATTNKMAGDRNARRRGVGPELGQRLVDLERKCWGRLIARLRTISGEEL